MKCVWVEAFERSQKMAIYGDEMLAVQPPVNRQLEGSSAWINMLTGVDKQPPAGWVSLPDIPVLRKSSVTNTSTSLSTGFTNDAN
jgi:hypothetical protein